MSALRKAGVWLGLIEDDDDRGYGYDDRSYDEDYPDDEVDDPASVVRTRVADRLAEARGARTEALRHSGDHHGTAASRHGSDRHSYDRHSGERHTTERHVDYDDGDRGVTPVRQIGRPAALDTSSQRTHGDSQRAHGDSQRSHGDSQRGYGERMHSGDPVAYPTRDSLALAVPPPPEPEPPAPRPMPVIKEERRYQITTLHPATFNEARMIGEHFRDGVPVILNLTEMAEADAKRLVDFAAGLAFALRGTMERVTNRVFLLSPANIQVTAEDKAKIAEGGFFRP